MAIEIEELDLHNEDLKKQLKQMTNKFGKLKLNLLEKDKDLNKLRILIENKYNDLSIRNSLTERNKHSLFKLEKNIIGIPNKDTNFQSNFNNSILIESALLTEDQVKLNKTIAQNKYSIKDFETINSNNNENIKKNTQLLNFVSSPGIEDITQYNTAVSINSSILMKKNDNPKMKNVY